ncbi:MAG TPA: hypothetical protein VK608_06600 [Edaphobacter sp.]|nr:hypothetical protein [Edaphobacter sp.]
MKTGTMLATTLFALASFPLLAQQPPPANQTDSPATQENPPATAAPNSSAASPEASAPETSGVEMSPVNAELVSKLDSKTAKTGDSVVVQTKASIKTADGTEIPKGSKLVGHVLGAQASGAGENSQVAIQFDHFELKGGKSMPVHSQIQAIAPAGGGGSTTASAAMGGDAPSGSPAGGSSSPGASGANGGSRASSAPRATGGDSGPAAAGNGAPAAGTVVATTGKIAIRTTSIPGVLLANNAPGQQDPRMAQASSILLGAKQDIQLDGGTQMVLGVAAASGGKQ